MDADRSGATHSVYAAFCKSAVEYASRLFLHIPALCCQSYHDGPIDISYQELGLRVESKRKSYADAGYRAGQCVASLVKC